jgi:hypothetical protein
MDAGGNRYQIFGKVPLSKGAKRYGWGVASLAAILLISAVVGSSLSTSESGNTASGSPSGTADFQNNNSSVSDDPALHAQSAELDRRQADLQRRKRQLEFTATRIDTLGRDIENAKAEHPDGLPEPLYSEYKQKAALYDQLTTQYDTDVDAWNRDRDRYNADVKVYNDRIRANSSQSR